MSRYNQIRLSNFNYNDNGKYKIVDETFAIKCLNTILELNNGGGKTTIVRAICEALFYKDRRTSKNGTHFPQDVLYLTELPTFIMAEFKLDGNGGYVTFGTMYCRSRNNESGYEMLRFVSEYDDPNDPLSIQNLSFAEKEGQQYLLKNREECEALFNTWKQEGRFSTYSPTNTAQNNKYFEKLRECGIMYEDYQEIMKKVNMQEDDLSNVFKSEKTSADLIENWILPRIENHFSSSQDEMKLETLKSMIKESIHNAAEAEEDIKKAKEYKAILDNLDKILEIFPNYTDYYDKSNQYRQELKEFYERLNKTKEKHKIDRDEKERTIAKKQKQIDDLGIENLSLKYYKADEKLTQYKQKIEPLSKEWHDIASDLSNLKHTRDLNNAKPFYHNLQVSINKRDKARDQLEISSKSDNAIHAEKNYIGAYLKKTWNDQIEKYREDIKQCNEESKTIEETIKDLKKEQKKKNEEKISIARDQTKRKERCRQYDKEITSYNKRWSAHLSCNLMGDYQSSINQERKTLQERKDYAKTQVQNTIEELNRKEKALSNSQNCIAQLSQDIEHLDSKSKDVKKEYGQYIEQEKERSNILTYLKLSSTYLYKTEEILKEIERRISRKDGEIEDAHDQIHECEKQLAYLKPEHMPIASNFKAICDEHDVSFMSGKEYLKQFDENEQEHLIKAYPLLPYSIVLTNHAEALLNATLPYTKRPVLCIDRKQICPKDSTNQLSFIPIQDGYVYANFDTLWLNDAYIKKQTERYEKKKARCNEQIAQRKEEQKQLNKYNTVIERQNISEYRKTQLTDKIENLKTQIETKRNDKGREEERFKELKNVIKKLGQDKQKNEKGFNDLNERSKNLSELDAHHSEYYDNYQGFENDEKTLITLENTLRKIEHDIETNAQKKDGKKDESNKIQNELEKKEDKLKTVQNCENAEKPENFDDTILSSEKRALTRFKELSDEESNELKILEKNLKDSEEEVKENQKLFQRICEQNQVDKVCVANAKELSNDERQDLDNHIEALHSNLEKKENVIDHLKNEISIEEHNKEVSEHDLAEKYQRYTPLPREQVRGDLNFEEEKHNLKNEIKKLKHEKKQLDQSVSDLESYRDEVSNFLVQNKIESSKNLDVSYFDNDSPNFIRDEFDTLKELYLQNYNYLIKTIKTINPYIQTLKLSSAFNLEHLEELDINVDAHVRSGDFTKLRECANNFYQIYKKNSEDVENSKDRILTELISYIQNVYQEFNRFGKNVNVTFDDGTKARLFQIKSPKWNNTFDEICKENAKIYLDALYEKGITLINQKSKDPKDTFENMIKELNTKEIFPKVVKANITVKVLKFETSDHIMKDWETIMQKNSGAERIVSSFIILCCLMQYQHQNPLSNTSRLKSDSKVLILDNPFGRLTSDHLLAPFIQCAKSTNTQILCFTDVSQSNVPDKFPNIINLMLYKNHLKIGNQRINQQEAVMTMEHQQISIIDRIH